LSRRWLITGASSGIGLALARQVIDAGDCAAIIARGERILALGEELGERCLSLQADVTDEDSVSAAVAQAAAHWGGLDVIVNNAGLHRGGRLSRLAPDDWHAVLQTNLSGAMYVIRAADRHLESGSSIINVGAVVGFRGFPGDAAYAASKAGLSGLTRALAIEYAPRGICVNLVIPGLVLTEMTGALSGKALDSMRQMIPMGRYGEPDEIAEVVRDVSRSRYMTGAFIPVDGGLLSSFGIPG
jgi:3-oxoacyl-[acyl-carrier protein] reductase